MKSAKKVTKSSSEDQSETMDSDQEEIRRNRLAAQEVKEPARVGFDGRFSAAPFAAGADRQLDGKTNEMPRRKQERKKTVAVQRKREVFRATVEVEQVRHDRDRGHGVHGHVAEVAH